VPSDDEFPGLTGPAAHVIGQAVGKRVEVVPEIAREAQHLGEQPQRLSLVRAGRNDLDLPTGGALTTDHLGDAGFPPQVTHHRPSSICRKLS
jgi:hypothetical protein